MARAQFQKGQKVWVESVGAWAEVEKINAVWAKGFDEPVRVSYDVGLGREFQAAELMTSVEDEVQDDLSSWRLLRARNKWQTPENAPHHPFPGTYPVVVTDAADWGGWRVPGAEYDRDPARIEFQARLIAAAPQLMALAEAVISTVSGSPETASPENIALSRRAEEVLKSVKEVLSAAPDESAVARRARESGVVLTVAGGTRFQAA